MPGDKEAEFDQQAALQELHEQERAALLKKAYEAPAHEASFQKALQELHEQEREKERQARLKKSIHDLQKEVGRRSKEQAQVVDEGGERKVAIPGGAVREWVPGKGRFELIPPEIERRLALHFQAGAEKYAAWNWSKGLPLSDLLGCALRHANKIKNPDERAEDHLGAALWNLGVYAQTERWILEGKLPAALYDVPWPPTVGRFPEGFRWLGPPWKPTEK